MEKYGSIVALMGSNSFDVLAAIDSLNDSCLFQWLSFAANYNRSCGVQITFAITNALNIKIKIHINTYTQTHTDKERDRQHTTTY